MATIRKAKNFLVYVIALAVTGILSFLGFRGPSWACAAIGTKHSANNRPTPEASPALARAVAAAGPHAKTRVPSSKKRPNRATGKKIAIKKAARERTSQVSSL